MMKVEMIIDNQNTNCRIVDFSFVILTWNSVQYIEKCINSFSSSIANEGYCAEFLIVDNGSSDKTCKLIEESIFPNLLPCCNGILIKLKNNLGTTKSRNIAIRKSKGKFVVICDSDTEFLEGSWKDLICFIERNIDVGIVAPFLCLKNGTTQNSVKKFPTIIDKLKKLKKIFFNIRTTNSDFYENFCWDNIIAVDTAISACWIIKNESFEKIGYLDENIFYSPEDLDYCLRVWEHEKLVVFYPSLKIMHHTQQLSHSKPFSRQALNHMLGLLYFFRKHKYFISREKLAKRLKIKERYAFR